MKKRKLTLDEYEQCGAAIRACNAMLYVARALNQRTLPLKDVMLLSEAQDRLEKVRRHAAERMGDDYPNLPDDYWFVFNGITENVPRNEIDARVKWRMKRLAFEVFEGKLNWAIPGDENGQND